jgi:VanZ family protein
VSPRTRNAALLASVVAILALTLAPVDASNDVELVPLGEATTALARADGARLLETLLNGVANVLLFAPLGIALALGGVTRARSLALALSLSAAVEVTQLFVSGRTASVEDVVLNVLGALLGYTLPWRWSRSGRASARKRSRSPERGTASSDQSNSVHRR